MKKFEVILVDDHPLIRDGLRDLINLQPDMHVVAEAETGVMALELIRKNKPCVVVLDIGLPDYNGLEIAAEIQKLNAELNLNVCVIILTMFLKENLVYQALQNGAKGYIVKTASSIEIVQSIRSVCQGNYYLSPEVSTRLIPAFIKSQTTERPYNAYNLLTVREQQVFRLLAEGHTNKEIAKFLSISPKTIERHRANIMEKLELRSYHGLLKYALELGIIEASTP